MATIDELLDETNETVSVCEIDPITRVITIPDKYESFGVESDEKAKRIPFRCKKIVDDGIDLSSLNLYINYSNGKEILNVYSVDDVTVDGDYITFSWLLSRNVTEYSGIVQFLVCAKKTEDDEVVLEWNSRIAIGTVESGLEAVDSIERSSTDVIDQIIVAINKLNQRVSDVENATAINQSSS